MPFVNARGANAESLWQKHHTRERGFCGDRLCEFALELPKYPRHRVPNPARSIAARMNPAHEPAEPDDQE